MVLVGVAFVVTVSSSVKACCQRARREAESELEEEARNASRDNAARVSLPPVGAVNNGEPQNEY
jgi:hypothetical protein